MKKKTSRLDAIKSIISTREIGSQEELLLTLQQEGFVLTQATLSRDLKQLNVAKAPNPAGKYVYVLHNDILYSGRADAHAGHKATVANGFLSLQFSRNIAVIRTRPGYAGGIAYDIDNSDCPEVLGTIAGDDTIMMVLREKATHEAVRRSLSRVIPNIR